MEECRCPSLSHSIGNSTSALTRTISINSSEVVIGVSLMDVITSPDSRPIDSAGVSESTSLTSAPLGAPGIPFE